MVWAAPSERSRELGEHLRRSARFVSESANHDWDEVEHVAPRTSLAQWLGDLTDEELEAALRRAHLLDCDEGAKLTRRGHVSRTIYVLLSGSLLIRDNGRTLAEVDKPGTIVGEVAMFGQIPRLADVVVGPRGAQVLALSERSVWTMLDGGGRGAVKFMIALTRGLCAKLHERASDRHGVAEVTIAA